MNYPNIATRVFNTPLCISEDKLAVIMSALHGRLDDFQSPLETPTAGELFGNEASRKWPGYADAVSDAGIAVINVSGTLVNRYANAPSGVTSYDAIADSLALAANRDNVRGILLRIDSFGGESAGLWDLGAKIQETRKKKAVWASVDSHAYSAAYLIASQAERIMVVQNGGVGSVGVIAVHWDWSENLKNEGIKPTLIFAGKHKADGNPFEPLKDPVRAKVQGHVNDEYAHFVSAVAAGRGKSADHVRGTEADTYRGQQAIDIGFADAIGTFGDAVAAFSAALNKKSASALSLIKPSGTAAEHKESESMSQPNVEQHPTTPAAGSPASPPLVVDATKIEQDTKARIAAILNCDEAKGRETLARHLAFETSLSADAAKAMLKAAPVAAPPLVGLAGDGKTPLERAMAAEAPNPPVAPGDGGGGADDPAAIAAEMGKLWQARKGGK